MSGPFQVLNHSDPGRLANGQTNGPHEAKPLEVRHLSAHTSLKNSPVACFDPSHDIVPTRNPIIYNKRAADPVHSDLARLLVKNKNLLTELRNLQKKLSIKETSLQEMKTELESYKENNMQQLLQIMSLKDDIKDLQELTASLTRIKSLKNTNIQSLKRGNWDLTERIIELENQIRAHLLEREKAEQRVDFLKKKFSGANTFTPYIHKKGQEDSLDIFMMKENSKTTNSQIDEHSEKFKQLEENNTRQMLLNIRQNLQIATTQRLEEKIQKLQKQLSDLKLSNKSMKTQLTRVNVLKDKTIEKLRKSLTNVETMKEKTVMKTENLKATLDSGEQEVRSDTERAHHQMLDAVTPELSTAKSTLEEVSGQEQKLADFRETIMKMLGFNMKTADKEIINQLRLIIQVYEISKKSNIASDCETRQDNK